MENIMYCLLLCKGNGDISTIIKEQVKNEKGCFKNVLIWEKGIV